MPRKAKAKKPDTRTSEELLDAAQELIYDAWEMTDQRSALALARKALKLSPDCADAWVILGHAARTRAQALEIFRKAVEAGERAVGEDAFKSRVGDFWGILETRPYMRALYGLAECLWWNYQDDTAIALLYDMLRLNPDDNQGVRYPLVSWLVYCNRDAEAAELIHRYGDIGAYFPWMEALLLFRAGGDNPKSRRVLDLALASNIHIPGYLLGQKKLPRESAPVVGLGDEREARWYAEDNLTLWKITQGAIAWLAARISAGRPALLH